MNAGESTANTNLPIKQSALIQLFKSRLPLAALGLVISCLLLFLLAKNLQAKDVVAACTTAVWLPWLPLSVAVYAIGLGLRGWRLKLLASEESQLSVLTATNIVAIGFFANNVLPARLGEFVRAGMLTERTGLPYIESLTIAVAERLFDGMSIVAWLLAAALFLPLTGWMLQLWQFAGLMFSLGFIFVFFLAATPQLLINITSAITDRTMPKFHTRFVGLVSQVSRGLAFLNSYPRTIAIAGISLGVWFLEATFFALIMPCLSLPINLPIALLTMGFTNLGILIPSGPGFVGTYHYWCKVSLTTLYALKMHIALPELTAVSYAVIVHLIFFAVTTIWGAIALSTYAWRHGLKSVMQWQAKSLSPELSENIKTGQWIASARVVEIEQIRSDAFWRNLCEALVGDQYCQLLASERDAVISSTTEFTLAQLSALPKSLRLQLAIGVSTFKTYALLAKWRSFNSLGLCDRSWLIENWASGPIPTTRHFVRALRAVTLLAFFENPIVQSKLAVKVEKNRANSAEDLKRMFDADSVQERV